MQDTIYIVVRIVVGLENTLRSSLLDLQTKHRSPFFGGYDKAQDFNTPTINLHNLGNYITSNDVQGIRRRRMARRELLHMLKLARRCILIQGQHLEGRAAP